MSDEKLQRKFLAECAGFAVVARRDDFLRELRYWLYLPGGGEWLNNSFNWEFQAWDAAWVIMQGEASRWGIQPDASRCEGTTVT